MAVDFALYSKRVITPEGELEGTVLVGNGRIKRVVKGKLFTDQFPIEDLGDLVVMPGLIDAHVHINDPGRAEWEGFEYASRAAAAGGFTTLIDMPLNSNPVTISKVALQQKITAAKSKLYVNCGFWGGLIPGNVNDLEELLEAGVWGIKTFLVHSGIDAFPPVTEPDLKKAMAIMRHYQVPLLVHAELEHTGPDMAGSYLHPTSYDAYLRSRPDSWEDNAIRLLLTLAEEYRCKTHIVHLSSAMPLGRLLKAREAGLPITSETCPHYLFFQAEDIPDGFTQLKCAPPIRRRANNEKLWEALKHGILDFIASDHSPCLPGLRHLTEGNFFKAWGGIAGLQWSLPVVWTAGEKRQIDLKKMTEWMSSNVAEFLGLDQTKGKIKEGYDADIVVWDSGERFEVTAGDINSRHKISPYLGRRLRGRVKKTFIKGHLVYNKGSFPNIPKGEILLRK